jgi:hypothetical protein
MRLINIWRACGGKRETEMLWETAVQDEISRGAFGYQTGLDETIWVAGQGQWLDVRWVHGECAGAGEEVGVDGSYLGGEGTCLAWALKGAQRRGLL